MSPWASVIPWVGGLLSLGGLLMAFRNYRRKALIEALPTSRALGVFIGLVEMKGASRTEQPLRSYLAELPCIYYQWEIEEEWERTTVESTSSGPKTSRESGWTNVGRGEESQDFYIEDATGAIRVRTEGAEFDAPTVFSRTCRDGDPVYYEKGPPGDIQDSTGRRRFTERAIRANAPVYVVGKARERKDIVAAEIAKGEDIPLFLVSGRTEKEVQGSFFWRATAWSLGGLALLLLGFVAHDVAADVMLGERRRFYVGLAACYLAAWLVAWVWNVFNDLVSLRNRVREGWGLIDIQLKRRHDLIPRLVTIAQALRDHERALQEQLALLRSQAGGKQAPADERALRPALRVMQEKYPALKAFPAFQALQKGIVETEERIALARDYYNNIATHFNTRIESFPHSLVAALLMMRRFPLLAAQDFERAPPGVALAK